MFRTYQGPKDKGASLSRKLCCQKIWSGFQCNIVNTETLALNFSSIFWWKKISVGIIICLALSQRNKKKKENISGQWRRKLLKSVLIYSASFNLWVHIISSHFPANFHLIQSMKFPPFINFFKVCHLPWSAVCRFTKYQASPKLFNQFISKPTTPGCSLRVQRIDSLLRKARQGEARQWIRFDLSDSDPGLCSVIKLHCGTFFFPSWNR